MFVVALNGCDCRRICVIDVDADKLSGYEHRKQNKRYLECVLHYKWKRDRFKILWKIIFEYLIFIPIDIKVLHIAD